MTKDFKTMSAIMPKNMPRIVGNNQFAGKTILGLDGGYSSVKGLSSCRAFVFPTYAKKINENIQIVGQLKDNDILLKDNKTGVSWAVGSTAESMIDKNDLSTTTDDSIFTRYRYKSEMYKICMAAGMAIGLLDTELRNEIYISTGLPSEYLLEDKEELVKALAGEYDISVKIGNAEFETLRFTIFEDHINVMEQPQGTLYASAYDKNGILIKERSNIMSDSVLVDDIGFGTEDLFAIRSGFNNGHQTYTDTGMRATLEETIKEIAKRTKNKANYKIFEFQKFLESGMATYFDRSSFESKTVEFEEILRDTNIALCKKSTERLMETYDNLLDYKYLIITGGTGESRFNEIKEHLSGLKHLTILRGNENDDSLPFAFSNVRGYYLYQYHKLKKEMKEKRNAH